MLEAGLTDITDIYIYIYITEVVDAVLSLCDAPRPTIAYAASQPTFLGTPHPYGGCYSYEANA